MNELEAPHEHNWEWVDLVQQHQNSSYQVHTKANVLLVQHCMCGAARFKIIDDEPVR